jgi:tRNA pseudouridine38-40 synthase
MTTRHSALGTRHSPPPRRLRLTVAYDGAAFYGAQVQPGRRTVGSELAGALARIAGAETAVTFAGRTDRGVHAAGQVAHCDVATPLTDERLFRALNAVLPTDVAVLRLETAPAAFHARYDARWREYRYQVWNAPVRTPALARTTWHLTRPLDAGALNAAVAALLGEHDFAAFAGQGLGVPGRSPARSTVREVHAARWTARPPDLPDPPGRLVELRIRANGFLPQMVRTIVGAAVEVGMGRRDPAWFAAALAGRRRADVPAPAPPQGLSLWAVGYDERGQRSALGGRSDAGEGEGDADRQLDETPKS